MSKGTPFFLLEQTPFSAGQSLPGAKLYFYQTGTTTEQTVYQESTLSTSHTQPITADASGFFDDIWLDPNASVDYRVKLDDSDDTLVWQIDNVPRQRSNFLTGTFEVTYTGFSADPSATTATYYQQGRFVFLELPVGNGTSNSTEFTMTGLPVAIRPTTTQYHFVPYAADNSSVSGGAIVQILNSSQMEIALAGVTFSTTTWTASGTKGLNTYAGFWYRLDDT